MATADPKDEAFFRRGTLLDHCAALRASATGMADPLSDHAEVAAYVARRLSAWKDPGDAWDFAVFTLCKITLREYAAPPWAATPERGRG